MKHITMIIISFLALNMATAHAALLRKMTAPTNLQLEKLAYGHHEFINMFEKTGYYCGINFTMKITQKYNGESWQQIFRQAMYQELTQYTHPDMVQVNTETDTEKLASASMYIEKLDRADQEDSRDLIIKYYSQLNDTISAVKAEIKDSLISFEGSYEYDFGDSTFTGIVDEKEGELLIIGLGYCQ